MKQLILLRRLSIISQDLVNFMNAITNVIAVRLIGFEKENTFILLY